MFRNARLFRLTDFEQYFDCCLSHLILGLMNGSQRRMNQVTYFDIIEANYGKVIRNR